MSASSSEDDYPNASAAFNQSIYVMVGVPYASLALCGFLIYRGCKMNAAYVKSLEAPTGDDPPA